MAFSLGDIIVTIKSNTTDLKRGLAEVQSMATKTADLGNRISAGLEKSTDSSRKFAVGVLAAGTAVVGLGVAGVKSAATFEQSRIAFETMLGSAERAQKLMMDISQFAKETPFELQELIRGSKQLIAYGFAQEELLPTMRKLGDLASGLGVPFEQLALAYGQVRVKGHLMGQETLQFTNAGVPIIKTLAKTLGKTTDEIYKMQEAGQIGFGDVEKAMNSLTGTGSQFGGMMEKQSKTFNGVVSNIKDGFGQFLRTMVGITNSGDIIEGGLFDKLKGAAEKVLPVLARLPQTLADGLQKLKPWLTTIIGLIIGGLVPAAVAAGAAFASWLFYLAPFLAAGAALGYLWQKNKLLFFALAGAITGFAAAIITFLMPSIIASVTGFAALAAAVIAATWPFILAGAVIAGIAYLLVSNWSTVVNWLVSTFKSVADFFVSTWQTIYNAVSSALNAIWNVVQPVLNFIWNLFIIVFGGITLIVISTLQGVLNAIISVFSAIWGFLEPIISTIVNGIINFFAPAFSWLYNKGKDIVLGLARGVRDVAGEVWGAIKFAADKIGQFFGGAAGWLWDVGRAIIMGLVNGMKSAVGWVNEAVGNVADAVKNKLKNVLGIRSPSKVFFEYGININQGLIKGLEKTAGMVQDALTIPMPQNMPLYGGAGIGSSNSTSVQQNTNINGPIIIGSKQDADYLLKKIDRNGELEEMGLATNE